MENLELITHEFFELVIHFNFTYTLFDINQKIERMYKIREAGRKIRDLYPKEILLRHAQENSDFHEAIVLHNRLEEKLLKECKIVTKQGM